LQVIGAINANHALLAKRAGFRAIYLSGGGVAAGSLGLPDLGINTLEDVLVDVRRITDVCDLPLMVDIDTGFGPSAFNIARTVKSLIKAGALGQQGVVGVDRADHLQRRFGSQRLTEAGTGGERGGSGHAAIQVEERIGRRKHHAKLQAIDFTRMTGPRRWNI
jgi:isocitrate lyase